MLCWKRLATMNTAINKMINVLQYAAPSKTVACNSPNICRNFSPWFWSLENAYCTLLVQSFPYQVFELKWYRRSYETPMITAVLSTLNRQSPTRLTIFGVSSVWPLVYETFLFASEVLLYFFCHLRARTNALYLKRPVTHHDFCRRSVSLTLRQN